jgi:dGTPase
MPRTRQELEQIERQHLCPVAQFSADTRGRVFPETPPEWRTEYQRDRDRVIHSRAFRRLEYKTQVFLNGTGDHLRTRLTHSMEVAATARSIARALRLNEDLSETIALAHDLGHAPFGHTGEEVLQRLMKAHGGFEHNRQSLRIVEQLEQKYPGFPGLNLTWESREGLMKHEAFSPPEAGSSRPAFPSPSIEAQVTDLADEITYYSHDLDDGLECGLLDEKQLAKEVGLWFLASRVVRKEHGSLPDEPRRYFIIRNILDLQIRDVVLTSEARIQDSGCKSADDVRRHAGYLVGCSEERACQNRVLRSYLFEHLYHNPQVKEPNTRSVRMLEDLFLHFLDHPEEIGRRTRKRSAGGELHRAVCDYVSGMTDRYAIGEHSRLIRQGGDR